MEPALPSFSYVTSIRLLPLGASVSWSIRIGHKVLFSELRNWQESNRPGLSVRHPFPVGSNFQRGHLGVSILVIEFPLCALHLSLVILLISHNLFEAQGLDEALWVKYLVPSSLSSLLPLTTPPVSLPPQ